MAAVLCAVKTIGETHAPALLPGMIHAAHSWSVLGGPVASMFVARVLAPAIVDDNFVLYGRFVEQPRQEFWAAPLGRREVPFAVTEDDRGFVARDQILELRCHVLGDIAGSVGQIERVVPLIQRIVETHFEALGTHRRGKITG